MIKKFFCKITLILIIFLSFSCSKKIITDDCGCYIDFDVARETAIKKNQNMLLFVTMDSEDSFSSDFVRKIISNQNFSLRVMSEYVVVHFDFSQSSYEKTVPHGKTSRKETQRAERLAELMQENTRIATLLDVKYTPSMYILTQDGFYVAEVMLPSELNGLDDFLSLLEGYKGRMAKINHLVDKAYEGDGKQRVLAIDELYESTDEVHRALLSSLIKEVPSLDKNNETGLLSKYLLTIAESEAISYYSSGDVASAVKCYTQLTKSKFLEPEHKQQAYYMAAYILASSGETDINLVLNYLLESINAYPQGENVPNIQEVYDYFTQIKQQASAADAAGSGDAASGDAVSTDLPDSADKEGAKSQENALSPKSSDSGQILFAE